MLDVLHPGPDNVDATASMGQLLNAGVVFARSYLR